MEAQVEDGSDVSLDETLQYFFSREAVENGSKRIDISDVDKMLEPVSEEIEEELGIPIKYHRSEVQIYSQQIGDAVSDLIPLGVPFNQPYLELREDWGEVVHEKVRDRLPEDVLETLEDIYQSEEYRNAVDEYAVEV